MNRSESRATRILRGLKIAAVLASVVLAAISCRGTIDMTPPVVVDTTPKSGEMNADPALKEIRVTFDKDMMTEEMWSWVQESPDTFPATTGDAHYADKRTCVLPVALEPGKSYVVWINSERFDSFRSAGGIAATPYKIEFRTRK